MSVIENLLPRPMRNLRPLFKRVETAIVVATLMCATNVASAALDSPDLTELSLEELLNVEVTSAARKKQNLTDVTAAIFVISNEDIRRSGVTNIPDALRMVPGLQVARIDSNKWAISSRGFNGRFANKLLVLIDGRSVYSPAFSGVYWEVQDTLLEDVERIEVIRGPGATLWGANAVNGVINIITKRAEDTQGTLVSAGAGSEELGFGSLRYGTKVGESTYARAYVKYFKRDDLADSNGDDAGDSWDMQRGGFRMDSQLANSDQLTIQGDIYEGDIQQRITLGSLTPPFYAQLVDDDVDVSGNNILARWQRALSLNSDISLQFYFDKTKRQEAYFGEERETYDIDFQHRFSLAKQHDIIWGLGYRYTHDDYENTFQITADPESRSEKLWSGFFQDEIQLKDERFRLTLGSKIEHNDYTGTEVQPNIRLLWTPQEHHAMWAAASRAVRTPSRIESTGTTNIAVLPPGIPQNPGPFPTVLSVQGNSTLDSEDLLAYEIGYRVAPTPTLLFDTTLFYNVYDNLRSNEAGTPTLVGGTYVIQPLPFANKVSGTAYGVELATEWRTQPWWTMELAYTYLSLDLEADADSLDSSSEPIEGASPEHQVSLRSTMNVNPDVDLDLWLRYVDRLPSSGFPSPGSATEVDAYTTLDARLAWHPDTDLELAVVGQNLLDSAHLEGVQESFGQNATEVERSAYVTIKWQF